jgi:hypothetical protein
MENSRTGKNEAKFAPEKAAVVATARSRRQAELRQGGVTEKKDVNL